MFIYVLSLSLQIAGSVLLFVNCLGKTRQRIIDEFFGQSTIADNDIIIVIATSAILVLIEIIAANIISRHIYNEDMKVHYSELPENTARTMSIKDIDAMMNSILR